MSEVTPRFTRRTPLGQLHNTTPIITEKKTLTYDENIKPTMMTNTSAPQAHEEAQEQSEYSQTLKNAIKEANDENEKLRDRISELEALLAAGQDEIEQKDKAILELANLLENNKTLPKKEEPVKKRVSTVTKSKRSPSPSSDKFV